MRTATSLLLAAALAGDPPSIEEMQARGAAWLAGASTAEAGPKEAALAVQALERVAPREHAAAIERWKARARDRGSPPEAPRPAQPKPIEAGDAAQAEALRFLRAAGTNAAPRPSITGTPSYLGARGYGDDLDLRATYGELQDRFDAFIQAPGPLERIHRAALVLARYGSPRLVTRDGRSIPWAQEVLGAIRARWRGSEGAWGESTSGAPSVAATAQALLAIDLVEPWARIAQAAAVDEASGPSRPAELRGDCEECHRRLEPGLVEAWEKSRHHEAGVGCDACHGRNHSLTFRENGRVSPKVCGGCHARQTEEFTRSRHAASWETLAASALLAATPPAARGSCEGCHRVGLPQSDGTRGSCNYCHAGHGFSAAAAREPSACTGCHTGDDYPQDVAYATSKHGILYARDRHSKVAPTCATCHQPGGRHDDGFGITIGGSGQGAVLAGDEPPFPLREIAAAEFAAKRAEAVSVCASCHSSRLAEESLRRADEVKRFGESLLREAASELRRLEADGIVKGPGGSGLELGGRQTRAAAGSQGAEVLDAFYEMWRFHHAQAWKGAYHVSPSVANRWSRAGLAEDLARIRALARELREKSR